MMAIMVAKSLLSKTLNALCSNHHTMIAILLCLGSRMEEENQCAALLFWLALK